MVHHSRTEKVSFKLKSITSIWDAASRKPSHGLQHSQIVLHLSLIFNKRTLYALKIVYLGSLYCKQSQVIRIKEIKGNLVEVVLLTEFADHITVNLGKSGTFICQQYETKCTPLTYHLNG